VGSLKVFAVAGQPKWLRRSAPETSAVVLLYVASVNLDSETAKKSHHFFDVMGKSCGHIVSADCMLVNRVECRPKIGD
jgi:hypothetical protein